MFKLKSIVRVHMVDKTLVMFDTTSNTGQFELIRTANIKALKELGSVTGIPIYKLYPSQGVPLHGTDDDTMCYNLELHAGSVLELPAWNGYRFKWIHDNDLQDIVDHCVISEESNTAIALIGSDVAPSPAVHPCVISPVEEQ